MSAVQKMLDVHILVVDDESDNLTAAIKWLKNEFGYLHVETALTVAEATAKLHQPFDVIIADMRMQRDAAGGFAVLEEVKRRNITSVTIILTANDTVDDCRKAFKMGAWDYIRKNITGVPVFEVVDTSIQNALQKFSHAGNVNDREWIIQSMGYLLDNYADKYVAVLNNTVIADAIKREDLDDSIRRQNFPFYLTTIVKVDNDLFKQLTEHLIVFVEGPTDVEYIKTAITLLGREDLFQSMILDTIGNRIGNQSGGEGNLKNGFNFLKDNRVITSKVLFLFDPDVDKLPNKGQDHENLYVRRMNDSRQKGIESLFADAVFEEGFEKGYVSKILRKREPQLSYAVEDKKHFCDWMCKQRENHAEDFVGFGEIIQIIDNILKAI